MHKLKLAAGGVGYRLGTAFVFGVVVVGDAVGFIDTTCTTPNASFVVLVGASAVATTFAKIPGVTIFFHGNRAGTLARSFVHGNRAIAVVVPLFAGVL